MIHLFLSHCQVSKLLGSSVQVIQGEFINFLRDDSLEVSSTFVYCFDDLRVDRGVFQRRLVKTFEIHCHRFIGSIDHNIC